MAEPITIRFFSPGIKPPAHTEHKITWRMESHKAIAGAYKKIASDKCFKREKLIPAAKVISSGCIEAMAYAYVDGENGHLKFGSYAETGHNAVTERLSVKLRGVDRS